MAYKISSSEFVRFLVEAKKAGYAGNRKYIENQTFGFKEFEFEKFPLIYRDEYAGYNFIQGQEIVRCENKPIWGMSYSGGIVSSIEEKRLVEQTFNFLKEALKRVNGLRPFRGSAVYADGLWEYKEKGKGDIDNFKGIEKITYFDSEKGRKIYELNYVGGLIVPKDGKNPIQF